MTGKDLEIFIGTFCLLVAFPPKFLSGINWGKFWMISVHRCYGRLTNSEIPPQMANFQTYSLSGFFLSVETLETLHTVILC